MILMNKLALSFCIALSAHLAYAQSEPTVAVDNIAVTHEHKGWRVTEASTTPIHFNLVKGDLIVRIDGKNAADTGPMIMASLFNEGYRRKINLFIDRNGLRMETGLREIPTQDYEPVGANPLKHVASGFIAPDAEFSDIDNQPVTLDQFKGKWLLIDFMGTWCPPCREGLPKVLSIAESDQLSLLMVAINDKAEALRRMKQINRIASPIAMMPWMAQLPISFGITTSRYTGQIPAYVLVRPDGQIALIAIGAIDAKHLGKTIDCIMNCKASEEVK
jgi:thiol-disulfide isomerase/thioredoxin